MAKNEAEETSTQEEIVEVPEDIEEPNITVADLQVVLNVIDLASSRGAFRGKEMVPVGNIYAKVEEFVTKVTATPESSGD